MQLLGGQALPNGVKFASTSHIVKVIWNENSDTLIVKEIKMPYEKAFNIIRKIPLLRGASIIFQQNLKATVILLLISLVCLFLTYIPQQAFAQTLIIRLPTWTYKALPFLLVASILFSYFGFYDLWQYHGAEHKTFNAYRVGQVLTIENVRMQSRVCDNCGTNLLMFVWPLMFLLSVIPDSTIIPIFLGLGIGYELFRLKKLKIWTAPFYKVGGLVQKYIVTREPNDKQIEVAIKALLEVERLG